MTFIKTSRALLLAGAAFGLVGVASAKEAKPTDTAHASAPASAPVASDRAQLGTYGFDATGMDPSVKPGDDFYAYANGTWAKNTEIPADKSNYGMFTALDDLSQKRTQEILEESKSDPNSKIGRAYASFLDSAAVETLGLSPIQPLLNTINSAKKSDLPSLLAKLERDGVSHFFGSYVGQDSKNPDVYIYMMGQSGLGMPDRDFYLKDGERNLSLRAAYLKHLENVLTRIGVRNAAARAKALYDFEAQIAQGHWDKNDSSDATKTYNKLTLAQLSATAPGFDWTAYVRGIGVTEDHLIVAQPSAFTAEAKLMAAAPIEVVRDLLSVRAIDSYSDVLPEAVANESFAFYGTALSGTPQMQERWKRAVDFTTSHLGDEIGQIYVGKYFPAETKAEMNLLVTNVIAAMGRRIDTLGWMQPETKVKARQKLANFTTKIGYPDQWRDLSTLEMKSGDLFGNAVRARQFAHNDNISRLGGPIRKWQWFMTPMTVNAYANFAMNEIVFPAAILQPPFFDPKADPAINYGGIGAVIGHEISHHFDDQGAKYDEKGRLADWWTPQDVAAFETAGKALIAQYSAYEVLPGEKLDGTFTLGENIGDLAGLTVAYDAYRTSLGGKEAPVIDGMTGDQRFFLGWAQVWRRNYRDQNLSARITTDTHSPSIQRTWVSRNLDPWYKAFQVQKDQKLYLDPKDRVRIW